MTSVFVSLVLLPFLFSSSFLCFVCLTPGTCLVLWYLRLLRSPSTGCVLRYFVLFDCLTLRVHWFCAAWFIVLAVLQRAIEFCSCSIHVLSSRFRSRSFRSCSLHCDLTRPARLPTHWLCCVLAVLVVSIRHCTIPPVFGWLSACVLYSCYVLPCSDPSAEYTICPVLSIGKSRITPYVTRDLMN